MPEFHEKECKKCGLYLAPEFYHKNCAEKDGLQRRCKYCMAAYRLEHREKNADYQKQYRVKNANKLKEGQRRYYQDHRAELIVAQTERDRKRKPEIKEYHAGWYQRRGRDKQLQKTYGITLGQYNKMLADQSGVCAICNGICQAKKCLSVDHDHITGVIRGLLCHACNVGLGKFKDNPIILREAALYLERGGFR